MMVSRSPFAVGSSVSTDPNAQSFHSWNRRPRDRKQAEEEATKTDAPVDTIDRHAIHPWHDDPSTSVLNKAISLSQTQDKFLEKVQEALRRMGELSSLAQASSKPAATEPNYLSEFTHLQEEIREIGTKLGQVGDAFKLSEQETRIPVEVDGDETIADASISNKITGELQSSYNPSVTTIDTTLEAIHAAATIQDALETVSNLRTDLNKRLEKLGTIINSLTAASAGTDAPAEIQAVETAEERTQSLCSNILHESKTVMLAQANALPESTLRLLD